MKERKLGAIQKWILQAAYGKENKFREAFTSQDIYVKFYKLNGEPASDKQRVTTHNSLKSLIGRGLIEKNHGERASHSGHIYYSLTNRGQSVAYRISKQTRKEKVKEKEPEKEEIKLTPEKIVRLVRRSMNYERF